MVLPVDCPGDVGGLVLPVDWPGAVGAKYAAAPVGHLPAVFATSALNAAAEAFATYPW